MRRAPGKPALVWDVGALTFEELDHRAAALSDILATKGVKAGDRVALAIGNSWAFAVALLAGWKLGATVAPFDPLLKSEERADILSDLGPAILIGEGDVEAHGARGRVSRADVPASVPGPLAPALILYTSGSTGRPKGAVLSHAALALAIESWAGPVMAITPEDVVLDRG